MASEHPEPTVITLDNQNSVQIMSQYIELAQSKGAFTLAEAELLKRATDFVLNNVPDPELNASNSRQLLVQGIHKGQRHGAYTLNDAALLSKVVQYVNANLESPIPTAKTNDQEPGATSPNVPNVNNVNNVNNDTDDLSDLAEPIPLKPKEV